jgi:hypothetical protein
MRSRENLPLIAVSAAILIFIAASNRATSAEPRQLNGCRWSQHAATASTWSREPNKTSWNPVFPASPPTRPLGRLQCMKSSKTAVV